MCCFFAESGAVSALRLAEACYIQSFQQQPGIRIGRPVTKWVLGLNSFNSSSARFVEANGRHTDVGKQSSGNEVSVHPRSAW